MSDIFSVFIFTIFSMPNSHHSARPKCVMKDPLRYKTVLCRNNPCGIGFCPFGSRCQYAHGIHELRHRRKCEIPKTPPTSFYSRTIAISVPPTIQQTLSYSSVHTEMLPSFVHMDSTTLFDDPSPDDVLTALEHELARVRLLG